jgi:hypothetical protein
VSFPASPKYIASLLKKVEADIEASQLNAHTLAVQERTEVDNCEQDEEFGLIDSLAELIVNIVTTQSIMGNEIQERDSKCDNDSSFITLPFIGDYRHKSTSSSPSSASSFDERLHLKVLRSHNQVGCRVWEAGLLLAEVLVEAFPPEIYRQKTFVELGGGVGVTSLLLLASLPPSSFPRYVYITDYSTGKNSFLFTLILSLPL